MKFSSVVSIIVTFLAMTVWSAPFISKTIVKSAPAKNECKSFYYSGLAVVDGQNDMVRQIERAHLKRLAEFRRVYYHYEAYRATLPKEKRQAILAYKGTSYGEINKFLRTGETPYKGKDLETLKNVVRLIDEVIDQGPHIPRNIVLFRGIGSSSNSFGKARVGNVVTDQAFSSTSLSIRTAMNFAINMMKQGSPGILQVIHVKSDGLRGLYIEGQSMEMESEILVDRGSQYKVLRTQHVVIENKVGLFDGDLPTVIGDAGKIPLPYPYPYPEPLPEPPVLGEPTFKQLELFSPEELPIVLSGNFPVDPTSPVLPGAPGIPNVPGLPTVPGVPGGPGAVFPTNSAQPTHLIIQHLELIQNRE